MTTQSDFPVVLRDRGDQISFGCLALVCLSATFGILLLQWGRWNWESALFLSGGLAFAVLFGGGARQQVEFWPHRIRYQSSLYRVHEIDLSTVTDLETRAAAYGRTVLTLRQGIAGGEKRIAMPRASIEQLIELIKRNAPWVQV